MELERGLSEEEVRARLRNKVIEYVCPEKRSLNKREAKDEVEGRKKLGEGQWGRGTNDSKV